MPLTYLRSFDIEVTRAVQNKVATQCYALFREAYPENWQTILETFEKGEGQLDGSKTIAQRQSLFHRTLKHHTQAVSVVIVGA